METRHGETPRGERRQVQTVICELILSLGNAQNPQIHRDREQRSGCHIWGKRGMGVTANGYKVSSWDGVLESDSTDDLLPGKSHGWRSLVGCSPWGC